MEFTAASDTVYLSGINLGLGFMGEWWTPMDGGPIWDKSAAIGEVTTLKLSFTLEDLEKIPFRNGENKVFFFSANSLFIDDIFIDDILTLTFTKFLIKRKKAGSAVP